MNGRIFLAGVAIFGGFMAIAFSTWFSIYLWKEKERFGAFGFMTIALLVTGLLMGLLMIAAENGGI